MNRPDRFGGWLSASFSTIAIARPLKDHRIWHRLQVERLQAVHQLAALATKSAADFILIAGDMFDSSHATKATVSAACAAIGTLNIPVLVNPPASFENSGQKVRFGDLMNVGLAADFIAHLRAPRKGGLR